MKSASLSFNLLTDNEDIINVIKNKLMKGENFVTTILGSNSEEYPTNPRNDKSHFDSR